MAPRRSSTETGRRYERLAADFYRSKGFEVLQQNYRDGSREIDLIVRMGDLVVFVEVKAARSGSFGHPAERIDQRKIRHLTRAAQRYVENEGVSGCDLRFDLVAFSDGRLEHYPNAFEAAPDSE